MREIFCREFGAAPLALLCSRFGTNGSEPAALHRGLTFSERDLWPWIPVGYACWCVS